MIAVVLSLVLGAVLIGSAALKLADGPRTRLALATYGLHGERAAIAWAALVAVEPALGVAVAAGVEAAAWAAAALLWRVRARPGRGARVRPRRRAVRVLRRARARRSRLARARRAARGRVRGAAALDRREPSTEGWLAVGLGVALLGLVALGVAVLALARELGALRAEIDPRGALEIPEEGPELGGRTELMEVEPGRLGLAVFTSEGCGMCRALEPAIEALGRDPLVRLRTFDEVRDAARVGGGRHPGQPVRGRGRRGRHRAGEGHVQHRRAARVGPRHRRAAARVNESRRGFLAKVSGALMAVTGARTVGSLVAPGEAEAYHFCGHIYTTDSCPHPTGLPRIDSKGRPLRAKDGHRVDDLGRLVDLEGDPVDEDGERLTDAEGAPLPAASRTPVCKAVAERYGMAHPGRRRLVPLLRRPRAQARRLLLPQPPPHQRRPLADGLLLQGPPRVLRHVLPDEGAVLRC